MKAIKDLPNIAGFEFLAVKIDGTKNKAKVFKDEKGLHRIEDFKNTIGWIDIVYYDEETIKSLLI